MNAGTVLHYTRELFCAVRDVACYVGNGAVRYYYSKSEPSPKRPVIERGIRQLGSPDTTQTPISEVKLAAKQEWEAWARMTVRMARQIERRFPETLKPTSEAPAEILSHPSCHHQYPIHHDEFSCQPLQPHAFNPQYRHPEQKVTSGSSTTTTTTTTPPPLYHQYPPQYSQGPPQYHHPPLLGYDRTHPAHQEDYFNPFSKGDLGVTPSAPPANKF